jgi:hypothetical protein
MELSEDYVIPKRWLVKVALLAVALLIGISLVAAENEVQPDLRLNQVAHFGGDAFYCVDNYLNPTQQYSELSGGGFRLLDQHGQVLWFVPAATIDEATQQALNTGEYTLVAEGAGTYGIVSVYTFRNDAGDILFTFNGYDEWGKPNSMTFKFCEPVNPIPRPVQTEDALQSVPPPSQTEEAIVFPFGNG